MSRTHVLGPARGYWEGITHTENIDVTYHIGFDYSKSTEDQTTQEFTLSYEMSYGMEMEYMDATGSTSTTIGSSYTAGLMHDV